MGGGVLYSEYMQCIWGAGAGGGVILIRASSFVEE